MSSVERTSTVSEQRGNEPLLHNWRQRRTSFDLELGPYNQERGKCARCWSCCCPCCCSQEDSHHKEKCWRRPRVQCCIITTVIALVLVIALFFSAIPLARYIAQRAMNKAELTIGSMNFSNPGKDSATLSADLVVDNKVSLSVLLSDATLTLKNRKGSDFGSLTMPAVKVHSSGKTHFRVNTLLQVSDTKRFGQFAAEIYMNDSTVLQLSGSATVSISLVLGAHFTLSGINVDKSVTITGARGFPGNRVERLSLAASTDQSARVQGVISFNNPSMTGLMQTTGIGFRVFYKDEEVGQVTSESGNIVPGCNVLTISGELYAVKDNTTKQRVVDDLVSNYLGNRSTPVVCQGMPIESTAEVLRYAFPNVLIYSHLPPWNESVIESVSISSLDILEDETSSMLSALPGEQFVSISMNTSITINNPLGRHSAIEVEELLLDIELFGNELNVGELVTQPVVPVEHREGSWAQVELTLQIHGKLDIINHTKTWERFLDTFLSAKSVELDIVPRNDMSFYIRLSTVLGHLDVDLLNPIKATIPAMDSFGNVEVPSLSIVGANGGANTSLATEVEVVLNNPSVATLPLPGKLTLDILSSEGKYLGSAFGDDIFLRQGRNILRLPGNLCPCEDHQPVSALFSNYVNGNNSRVQVRGSSLVTHHGHAAPLWLQHVVRHLDMNATVKGLDGFPVVGNISAFGVGYFWEDLNVPRFYGRFELTVYLPFQGVDVSFGEAPDVIVDVFNASNVRACFARGLAQTDIHTCRNSSWKGKGITICRGFYTLNKVPLTVKDPDALGSVLQSVYKSNTDVPVIVSFRAEQIVDLPIGRVVVSTKPIHANIPVRGMRSLSRPPLAGNDSVVVHGYSDELIFNLTLHATNPSQTFGSFGDIRTAVYAFGQRVGAAVMKNLVINPGYNQFLGRGLLQPPVNTSSPEGIAVRQFLSNFFTRKSTDIQLVGEGDISPIPTLQTAFDSTVTNGSIEGIPYPMLNNATFNICTLSFEKSTIEIQIDMWNPLNTVLEVSPVNLTVSICKFMVNGLCPSENYSVILGQFYVRRGQDPPIILQPYETMWTSKRLIYLEISTTLLIDIILDDAFDGFILSQTKGTVTARTQNFSYPVDYNQIDLPLIPNPTLPEAEHMPNCDIPFLSRHRRRSKAVYS
eukprot:gb/GECG01016798.1/.p1 GENE.gb/GECG01016798.1/~~gb/GECG01016798.1/.p1  ORF type:complete len:1148 (+),score=77.39 gb/GECG01016798.1/:1-3444(+)